MLFFKDSQGRSLCQVKSEQRTEGKEALSLGEIPWKQVPDRSAKVLKQTVLGGMQGKPGGPCGWSAESEGRMLGGEMRRVFPIK